jgi:hypothetical protein
VSDNPKTIFSAYPMSATLNSMRGRPDPLRVDLHLPLHIASLPSCLSSTTTKTVVVINVNPPRAVWQVLQQLLFESSPRIARRATLIICQQQRLLFDQNQKMPSSSHEDDDLDRNDEAKEESDSSYLIESSNLKFVTRRVFLKARGSLSRRMSIVLAPPSFVDLEPSFEHRLIHLEKQLIRAQSMAGYLSTLGGGFFMCHHWRTAVAFAQQQKQMARLLGDANMYFKCLVNQAYNCTYAGQFRYAKKILSHVLMSVKQERPSEEQVLVNMVASAMLFCKRVQRYAKQQALEAVNAAQVRTKDDFSRIRLVQDASADDDIIRPFEGRPI